MFRILKQLFLATLISIFASQASAMFIQPDWMDPTQPGVGTNRYSYSGNDPVNRHDPGGNSDAAAVIGGGAAGVVCALAEPCGAIALGIGALAGIAIVGSSAIDHMNEPSGGVVDGNVSSISSGNPGVDGIFGGFDQTKEPKGQSYPGTLGELNGELAGLPGAKVEPRPNGGATITLPDGTKISTYPGRTSTGKPGFAITKPGSKKESIKGSTEGEKTVEADNDDQDNNQNDDSD